MVKLDSVPEGDGSAQRPTAELQLACACEGALHGYARFEGYRAEIDIRSVHPLRRQPRNRLAAYANPLAHEGPA